MGNWAVSWLLQLNRSATFSFQVPGFGFLVYGQKKLDQSKNTEECKNIWKKWMIGTVQEVGRKVGISYIFVQIINRSS